MTRSITKEIEKWLLHRKALEVANEPSGLDTTDEVDKTQIRCLLLDSLVEDLLTCADSGVFPWELLEEERI